MAHTVSVDVGGGDQALELEFSPDWINGCGRSLGAQETEGRMAKSPAKFMMASTGVEVTSFNPSSARQVLFSRLAVLMGALIVIGGREDVWVYDTGHLDLRATATRNDESTGLE